MSREANAAQARGTGAARRAPHRVPPPKGMGVQRAYDAIRDRILHLDLQPGENLDESALVATLGVSRTPVRQAFVQLQAEGLIELLTNRGARVAPLDLSTVREFFELFDVTQRMATRWAAARCTEQDLANIDAQRLSFETALAQRDVRAMMESNLRFHEAIGASCGNRLVAKQYTQLLTLALRLSRLALIYETDGRSHSRSEHLGHIVRDHKAMMELLSRGDAEGAERAAREHCELFEQRVREYMGNRLSSSISVTVGVERPRSGKRAR